MTSESDTYYATNSTSGTRVNTRIMDVPVPTLLTAAGIQPPNGLPIVDLWENMCFGRELGRDSIFGDSYAHDFADPNDPEVSLLYFWCIQCIWKLILTYDGEVNRYAFSHPRRKSIQLFDVVKDPHEMSNLADTFPQVVRKLQDRIEDWYPLRERRLHGRN